MLKIYKAHGKGENGTVGILTDINSPEEFMDTFGFAFAKYIEKYPDDLQHDISSLMPNVWQIALKLAGYKSESVIARQVFWSGDHWPEDKETCAISIEI